MLAAYDDALPTPPPPQHTKLKDQNPQTVRHFLYIYSYPLHLEVASSNYNQRTRSTHSKPKNIKFCCTRWNQWSVTSVNGSPFTESLRSSTLTSPGKETPYTTLNIGNEIYMSLLWSFCNWCTLSCNLCSHLGPDQAPLSHDYYSNLIRQPWQQTSPPLSSLSCPVINYLLFNSAKCLVKTSPTLC